MARHFRSREMILPRVLSLFVRHDARGKPLAHATLGTTPLRVVFVLPLLLGLFASVASAQFWPQKPVRVVVGNAPGSLSDILSRQIFNHVGQSLGQVFIVDNRAGAAGAVAAEAVARSPADGYTVLFGTDGIMAINPFVYAKLGYDPLQDFAPVSLLAKLPYVLIVSPALGVKSIEEFVAIAKARPGRINYSSGGNGHATHLEMELLARKAGIALVHVPYKGTAPAVQAVVSGEVGANMVGLGIALPQIASGKAVALVIGGPRGQDVLARVPNLVAKYPEAEYVSWLGLFAPAATPKPVIDRLNGAVVKALESPDVKVRLTELGMASIGSSPGELAAELRSNLKVTRDLVKSLGLKLD
jgi:tripartite-type tricarboxylate transporter receptor subunit TctC